MSKKSAGKKAVLKHSSRGAEKKKHAAVRSGPSSSNPGKSNNGKLAKVVVAPVRPVLKSAPVKVGSISGKAGKFVPAASMIKPSALKSPNKASRMKEREERQGINIPAPVPTDTKPAKNRAGLRSPELEHYRDLLLAKRRELVGDMTSMESEALQRGGSSNLSNLPMHMADMGTDNYEQEFTLGLMEKDRNLLREINSALAKIQDGSYGICEGTGNPINKARLEAQPWARYSIEHARKLEQRGVR
jgi:DnaK suppressor protein